MTSAGFSFNFLPATADTENSILCEDDSLPKDGTVDKGMNATPSGEASKTLLPFAWLADEDLGPLWNERSTEEIVYTDIPISDHSSRPADATSTTATATAATAPMRCVDLTISSYQKATTSDQEVWKTTDIEPGLYEGGRKVWECSLDLLHYLVEEQITLFCPLGRSERDGDSNMASPNDSTDHSCPLEHIFALELGCGHGLPGCYLLRTALEQTQRRASFDGTVEPDHPSFTVALTDYNESVILDATLSNLVLNCGHMDATEPVETGVADATGGTDVTSRMTCGTSFIDKISRHVLLGAGDWMDMSHQLQEQAASQSSSTATMDHPTRPRGPRDGTFHMIVASETLYSPEAARDTARWMQRHLRPDTGVAYVATKRYYFGVTGGVDAFRSWARTTDETANKLEIETVRVIDNGSGNIREVLRVRCYTNKTGLK